MRRDRDRARHVFGDRFAHRVVRNAAAFDRRAPALVSRGRLRAAARDVVFDVLVRDAAVAAGAGDVVAPRAVLGEQAFHQRRETLLARCVSPDRRRSRRHGQRCGCASPLGAGGSRLRLRRATARQASRPARLRRLRSSAIDASTPSAGAGTSTATLSVSSSTIGSSRFTASPTCFSHARTTDFEPSCSSGMTMLAVSAIRSPPALAIFAAMRSTDGSAHSISSG